MLGFDLLLAVLILGLAWRATSSRDLFESIVVFIALGLMVALAWVRLSAPDAALAEAAIGSGLAGALLLATWSRLKQQADDRTRAFSWSWSLVFSGLAVGLLLALVYLPVDSQGIMDEVQTHIPQSGVTHPVTAVLLNFRAWDTALELAVLAWAWFAQHALNRDHAPFYKSLDGQVLQTFAKWLSPLILIVGAYLLWRGATEPGGAFQAGAILAAGLVVYSLAYQHPWRASHLTDWVWRLSWVGGFWLFVMIGLVGLGLGFGFMGYPPEKAGSLILLIEICATLSIAFLLAAMFSGHQSEETIESKSEMGS